MARDTRGNPSVQSPRTISKNTGHDRKYVGQRCRHLVDHDLVEKVDTGFYRLSNRGCALMDGSLRPEDL
ncbi:MarR family transcriptional regulator [Natrialba taiwanensis]|nr:MarR family transcriptional regulator [Natrialba taiwanensis]